MKESRILRLGALAVAVVILATAGAGCIVQDKPEHAAFTLIAQAGHDVVEEVGHDAHFHWSAHDAVEAEGTEAPHVEVDLEWTSSSDITPVLSHGENATYHGNLEGFTLVRLNVSAEGVTASDVAVAVFTETPATGATLYVAAVGLVDIDTSAPGPKTTHRIALGDTRATLLYRPVIVSASEIDLPLIFDEFAAIGGPAEGRLIVAMRAPGVEWTQMTGPSEFEAGEPHILRIRTGATGGASLVVGAAGHQTTTPIEQYGEEHPAESEGRVLVSPSQSLPGFEAASATLAAAMAGALALVARRRPRA